MLLITGYGSIGSLVVDRFVGKTDIIIVDRDEKAIHKALTKFKDDPSIKCVVSDISIKDDISRIFLQYPIKKVIHTAAMKHVGFCEVNPLLATSNNVFGISNLLDLSIKAEVTNFINVSTDKSAYPSNVMGATKFIAERVVLLYGSMSKGSYQNVRLGNVLFSTGSLIPTIMSIVENGLWLDLTDLKATRFFVTPDEVSKFIADAAMGKYKGQILIKKLKSATLETMVDATLKLVGSEGYKNIRISGLRQGEKLHEHLYSGAEVACATDCGDYWSVNYSVPSTPVPFIDSSQFCVSEAEFLSILQIITKN